MPLQRGSDELHNEIEKAIVGEVEGGGAVVDPIDATTVEDQWVAYDVDSIEGNRLSSGGVDVTFHVSLVGGGVESLISNSNFTNRKILKSDDEINTTITFGDQLWYVLMGEYNFNYTVRPEEPLRMDGEIKVFDAERVE
jgi:hypothetical protein